MIDLPRVLDTRRGFAVCLAAVALLYLLLAASMAYTKRPGTDEACYAATSVSLLTHGGTGITVLHPLGNANMLGRPFPRLDQEYYIWFPLQQGWNALWFRFVGVHVLTLRAMSVLWGLLALTAWMLIMQTISGRRLVTLLAGLFIAADFALLLSAADGRADMMCAALSFSAIAAYLRLRERRLDLAVASSQALAVAAGLTHPMGAVGFLTLLGLSFYLDRRRLRGRHVLVAGAVYAVGAAAVAAYFLPNLPTARAQFSAALTGRTGVVASPLTTAVREFTVKYPEFYMPPSGGALARVRGLIPLCYAAGLLGFLGGPYVRIRPGDRTLLVITVIATASMAFLDSAKLYYYLVHSTPYLAAVTAAWAGHWLLDGGRRRVIAASVACLLLALQTGWVVQAAARDPYHRSYLPMTAFVSAWTRGRGERPTLVIGSAEAAFVLGFSKTLSDDALLGYQSGQRGDLIIWDQKAYQSHFLGFQKLRPEVSDYISNLLSAQYRPVYSDGYYTVFERSGTPR